MFWWLKREPAGISVQAALLVAALSVLLVGRVVEAKVYPIVEPDVMEEIQKKADPEKLKRSIEKLRKRIETELNTTRNLPVARKASVTYIDPTYCLDHDIKIPVDNNDISKGYRVLYPKGYCFNPVEYLPAVPPRMVVFNPCDPRQVKHVDRIKREGDMFVFAGCLKHPFKGFPSRGFPLTDSLINRFKLKEVISIISVDMDRKKIRVETVPPVGQEKSPAGGERP